MNTIKAIGEHYFATPHCPIGVTTVAAAPTPQHAHDLTDVLHYHDFAELVIITGGAGVQVINKVEYPVVCGDVFLLQGETEHAFRERSRVSLLNIQFAPELLPMPLNFMRKIPGYNVMFHVEPALRSPRNFKHRLHLEPRELSMAEDIVFSLRDELQSGTAGFEAAAFSLLIKLITFVSRQYSVINANNRSALVRMGDVISALESGYRQKWTLAKIARLAKTSPNNLLRLFKAATGEAPINYIIRLRLSHAAELLHISNLSITEIAFECGFHDPNYFTKKFTALYHMTPRQYRTKI